MNLWILILFLILIFAPRNSSKASGRLDLRALALLICVIALVSRV
jgi:hypothetical protein